MSFTLHFAIEPCLLHCERISHRVRCHNIHSDTIPNRYDELTNDTTQRANDVTSSHHRDEEIRLWDRTNVLRIFAEIARMLLVEAKSLSFNHNDPLRASIMPRMEKVSGTKRPNSFRSRHFGTMVEVNRLHAQPKRVFECSRCTVSTLTRLWLVQIYVYFVEHNVDLFVCHVPYFSRTVFWCCATLTNFPYCVLCVALWHYESESLCMVGSVCLASLRIACK